MLMLRCLVIICVLSVHVQPVWGDEYSYHYDIVIEQVDGQYVYELESTRKVKITQDHSSFSGFVEHELFYAPIEHVEFSASRSDAEDAADFRFVEIERKDVFLDDSRVLVVGFPDVEPGDVCEASVWRQPADIQWFPMLRVPADEHVVEFVVHIEHPENVEIIPQLSALGLPIELTYESNSGETTVSLSSEVQPIQLDFFDHTINSAMVLFEVTSNNKLLNAVTPASFVEWYFNLFPDSYEQLTDTDSFVVEQKAKFGASAIDSMYSFVSTQVRYIADERSIHGFVPRHPDSVLQWRYGDCKDKAFLFAEMCRNTNKKVVPVLVNTNSNASFESKTHVHLYNHVIAAVIDEQDTMYVDPTSRTLEYGLIWPSLRGKSVLILDPLRPVLTTIPSVDSTSSIAIEVNLEQTTQDSSSCKMKLKGIFGSWANTVFQTATPKEQFAFLEFLMGQQMEKVSLVGLDSFRFAAGTMSIDCKVDVSALLIESKSKTYVRVMPFHAVREQELQRIKDSLPMYFDGITNISLTLLLGKNYTEVDGNSVDVSYENFGFTSSIQHNIGNGVVAKFTRYCKTPIVTVGQKTDYAQVLAAMQTASRNVYTLKH